MSKRLIAGLAAAGMVLGVAGAADAAPPPERGFAVTVVCPSSGTYQAVIPPGHGEWVPAIRTGGRGVLHPVGFEGFHATLYDAETDEPIFEEVLDDFAEYRKNALRHPHGFERCAWSAIIHGSTDDEIPEGTYAVIGGTVLMRPAPSQHR